MTPSMRRIVRALGEHGDMDAKEIAAAAFVSENTLSGGGYLTKLLVMELIRVSKWERQEKGGPFIPVYSVTPGNSKPRPTPYTSAQKTKRWRQKAGYRSPEWKSDQQAKRSMNHILGIKPLNQGEKHGIS